MNDFQFYVQLGLEHVLDLGAYDHILFLLVLSVPYTFKSWKKLLWLVTLFTLGHTLSLVLSSYEMVVVNTTLIECLIPVTIFMGALYELWQAFKNKTGQQATLAWVVAIGFGLIHGFGFANYYNMIQEENELLPLVSFAVGVEISQVIVALIALVVAFVFQKVLKVAQPIYIKIATGLVLLITLPMLYEMCFLA